MSGGLLLEAGGGCGGLLVDREVQPKNARVVARRAEAAMTWPLRCARCAAPAALRPL